MLTQLYIVLTCRSSTASTRPDQLKSLEALGPTGQMPLGRTYSLHGYTTTRSRKMASNPCSQGNLNFSISSPAATHLVQPLRCSRTDRNLEIPLFSHTCTSMLLDIKIRHSVSKDVQFLSEELCSNLLKKTTYTGSPRRVSVGIL